MSLIREYIDGFYDGPHATPKDSESGPIFLGIKNVTPDGRLDFSTIKHVSNDEFPRWTKRVTPQKDDIVFSYEATLHRYAIIPEGFHGCLGRRMALMRPNKKKIDARFLHFYLLSPSWRKEAEASVISGATVDRIPLTKVPDFKVNFPDLIEQQRVASVLGAYDDLIENNRRRIALLEETARLLYREWFVNLRFPGYEHVKIIDGVPDGWSAGTVGDLARVKSGYAFKSKDWQTAGHPVVKIKNIVGDGSLDITNCDFVDDEIAEKAGKFQINSGSMLIAMTGATVGKVGVFPQTEQTYYLNQRVGSFQRVVKYPIENLLFTFFQEELAQAQVRNLAGGAAQPNISGSQIESIKLLIPDRIILESYFEFVSGMFEQRANILRQIAYLTQARDLLLPRLMDGRLEF